MMLKLMRTIMTVGLVFGIILALVSYLGNLYVDFRLLLLIPLFCSALSALGVIVASCVQNLLAARGLANVRTRYAIGFTCAFAVNLLIVFAILTCFAHIELQRHMILCILLGLVMGAAYSIYGFKMKQMHERIKFLQELADKNRRLQEVSRRLAITEERNRMGRELHDSISQGLHGLVFSIHSLLNELKNPPARVAAILELMEATAAQTLDELRAMIEELKPSLLAERGLAEALQVTADFFSQRQEIPVDLLLQPPENISPELETTVYRISQEALSNIEKHALARHVTLGLSCGGQGLLLTIKDDGRGFENKETQPGSGLKNMRRRAEEAGGTLDVVSRRGLGTSIIAGFPLKG